MKNKHTSIMLSEAQLAQIKETGKSPSVIIREALDAYFNPEPNAFELMCEHERLYHPAGTAHKMRMNMRKNTHEMRMDMPIPEHETSIKPDNEARSQADMPIIAHKPSPSHEALTYILGELKEGREPTVSQVADKHNVTVQALAKMLSPFGIRAQETKRAGVAGRYFTFKLIGKLEEILLGMKL